MASGKFEIVQPPAFSSVEEEALLGLLRASDCLNRAFQRRLRGWGVTATQYNVLRILGAVHPGGMTCSALGSRMIASEPDMTRLLNRMKAMNLIWQERDKQDRRLVWTIIGAVGLGLLREMEPTVLKAPGELLGHLTEAELKELNRLLRVAREPWEGPANCPTGE